MMNRRKIFENAPCLSPWYFGPACPRVIKGSANLEWKWVERVREEYVGMTFLQSPNNECYGILKTYVNLLSGPDQDAFLVWLRSEEAVLRLALYETSDLGIISEPEAMALKLAVDSKKLYYFNSSPKAIQTIPIETARKEQRISFDEHFKVFPDFCIVTEIPGLYENCSTEWHNTAIILVCPGTDRVFVYPQDWFNKSGADFGYQWITRAVRDARTGLICGQGIRIDDFVLDETNRKKKR